MQCATANPDGQKRALIIGGGIANFTDVAATFNGIIRALREKVPPRSDIHISEIGFVGFILFCMLKLYLL